MLAFHYQEVLHGGFYLLADPVNERAADLTLDVDVHDVTAFAQSRTAFVRGSVKLDDFADDASANGKIIFDTEQKRMLYEVSFLGTDGARYRLRGHKTFEALNLIDSFTLVRASLYDERSDEVGRAVVRFDARGNWRSLVRSFRASL